jgi:hypothetical protein
MITTEKPCPRGVRRAVVLAAALSLSLLGGCGGTDNDNRSSSGAPGVASIHQPSAAAARPATSERPLIRPDASEEERTRLQDVYVDCLWANGFPKQAASKGRNGGYPDDLEDFDLAPGVLDKIEKACGPKKPELPIQRAKRLDTDYADHLRANVKCLNDHGIKAVIQDNGPALVDGLPGDSKSHWLDDCERQAFAGYYSTLK